MLEPEGVFWVHFPDELLTRILYKLFQICKHFLCSVRKWSTKHLFLLSAHHFGNRDLFQVVTFATLIPYLQLPRKSLVLPTIFSSLSHILQVQTYMKVLYLCFFDQTNLFLLEDWRVGIIPGYLVSFSIRYGVWFCILISVILCLIVFNFCIHISAFWE